MLWLKRNLFLAAGGLIACVLLGFGIYYMLASIQENKTVEAAVEEKKDQLDKISKKDPFPSKQNIDIVRAEVQKLREIITRMRAHFTPVPAQRVIGKNFADLLANTLDEMRKKAEQSSVGLPAKKYAFSFKTQEDKLQFGNGSFPALPQQLAEIKIIAQVLCEARINKLINVRRTPVSADDEMQRASGDYHDLKITTNAMTGVVCRPYQVEFECFSAELATVLENFYKSKYALLIKSVLVEPTAGPAGAVTPAGAPVAPPALLPNRPPLRGRGGAPGGGGPAGGAAPAAPQELKTVLAERLLKVTLLLNVIQPGN